MKISLFAFLLISVFTKKRTKLSFDKDDRDQWEKIYTQYHTYEELDLAYDKIIQDQNSVWDRVNYLKQEILNRDPKLQLFKFKQSILKNSSDDKLKVFIIFGQHAREMITTEIALNFLKYMNKDSSQNKDIFPQINDSNVDFMLKNIDIQLVPIMNPNGKKKVDQGYSCWRSVFSYDKSKNKIDPNRNWADSWQTTPEEEKQYDSDGGEAPFTIAETYLVNEAIKRFDPDVFLDIHSGMEGLMFPRGSDEIKLSQHHMTETEYKEVNMLLTDSLNQIKDKFCKGCLVGEGFKVIKYNSNGDSIDHQLFTNNIPLSAIWEVYGDNSTLRMLSGMRMNKKLTKYQMRLKKMQSQGKSQLAAKMATEMRQSNIYDCFDDFNPKGDDYIIQVNKWTEAIFSYVRDAYGKKDQLRNFKEKRRNVKIQRQRMNKAKNAQKTKTKKLKH